MRLEFRSQGQADQYYKICKRILMEKSRGPEGVRIGIQRIRNAIYRGFGFNSFNEFLKVFVPNERIASWFHSKEQLNEALSRVLKAQSRWFMSVILKSPRPQQNSSCWLLIVPSTRTKERCRE